MNIAYKGHFLREGLLANGHHLYDLTIRNGENPGSLLKSLPAPIDLVVWELFGGFSALPALSGCDAPVAAYCVDTPLNEFWLKPCLENLDYVLVDQPQCVASLADSGIKASWLPLPAQKSWFQPKRDKKYDITFVGRTTGFRQKRNNLLKLLQTRFSVNVMSGLDIRAAQKVFSESRLTINENYFPGLTMRVLQGMSAGTAVFNEQSPYGHDFGLRDGRDVVCYNPDNVLERLAGLAGNYGSLADIAMNGQEKCRELYSCGRVAADFLSGISAAGMGRKELDEDARFWNQTISELLYAQRFGGNFSDPMRRLRTIAAGSSAKAWEAHAIIGDIQARFKGGQSAREHYMASLAMEPASIAGLKLALLSIHDDDPETALQFVAEWIRQSPGMCQVDLSGALGSRDDLKQGILSVISEIYFALGRQWDMGFQKEFSDPVPDTAYDIARLAWGLVPSAWALEMMSRCLAPWHLQGELLPFMLEAMKAGILSQRQKLEAAHAAFGYYDRDTAAMIMAGIKSRS